jgi:hypothetical protein
MSSSSSSAARLIGSQPLGVALYGRGLAGVTFPAQLSFSDARGNASKISGISAHPVAQIEEGKRGASAHRSLHLHFRAFELRPTAWLG